MQKIMSTAALWLFFLTVSCSWAATAGFGGRLEPENPSGGDLIRYRMQDLASQVYEDLYAVEVVDTPPRKSEQGKMATRESAEDNGGGRADTAATP